MFQESSKVVDLKVITPDGKETPVTPQLTPEQQSLENTKTAIRTVEGLFAAINEASFPLKWHSAALNGMQFIQQLHAQLVSALPKEELEKIKAEQMAKASKETK